MNRFPGQKAALERMSKLCRPKRQLPGNSLVTALIRLILRVRSTSRQEAVQDYTLMTTSVPFVLYANPVSPLRNRFLSASVTSILQLPSPIYSTR